MTAYAHLLMYFFFYSFLGWVWESAYVSVLKRHWTNRGFLTGPMLPIYGSGAVVMLCTTYPVRSCDIAVFFIGMFSATLLEYATGAAMEALFQVRYWDYSNKRFNLHGYICLSSSLAWGVFTLLLVRVIHPHVASVMEQIPSELCFGILAILSVLFVVDFAASFHAAMDLRHILESMTKLKADVDKLREHITALSDSISETLHDRIGTIKKPESSRLEDFQASVMEYLEKVSAFAPKEKMADIIRLKERSSYLGEFKSAITKRMDSRKTLLLKGNPMLTSRKYADALTALKEQFGLNKKDNKKR